MQQTQTLSSLKELLTASREIFTNGTTFEQYKEFSFYLIENEELIKGIIAKETIATLSRFVWHKDKKDRMVGNVYSNLCSNLTLKDSFQWSPTEETFKQAVTRILNSYTEAQYLEYKEQLRAEKEAKEKALNNPETLAEFRTFINTKGEAAFTPEQRIKYDELTADSRKEYKERQEEKKAEVKAVSNVNTEMVIKESFHAKKNIPLWVVVLADRVERSVYEELNNRAKKLGGYYSSYKGNGAIPGFTFEKPEAAKLFVEVKEGNVNAAELIEQVKEEKTQTRAEALRERGEAMINEGNEELGRDRQANTARRARFAAHAESKASNKIEFGKTLVKIADLIESGEVKYLDKISNLKDVENLQSVLRAAKYRHIRKENLNADRYEINIDTVNYCQLPYPVIFSSNAGEIMRMEDINGKKQAAARMLKRLKGVESITIDTVQRIEDFETLYCTRCAIMDTYRNDRYKEDLMRIKRLNRIGIYTIEELRAALREFLRLKEGATISEEQKRQLEIKGLERKFINSNIPGFFPTPSELAAKVVELANIQEGETVLEPSAGLGHIADEIKKAAPGCIYECIEQNYQLANALRLKGHETTCLDFLTYCEKQYDVIVMNPPFENGQDVDHVTHAFNLLNDGGRLVAIMANNKQRFPKFLEIVDKYGYYEENPAGSFASAFRPTGVSTITVYLSK